MNEKVLEKQDLVSVIMPVHNAEKYIRGAIQSVLSQTYSNLELIVVDDGSQDETGNIINSFQDNRIKFIKHELNLGVAEARNSALKEAKGRWVALIDSDDVWLPERLEKLVAIVQESREERYFVADDHIICFDSPERLKKWDSEFTLFYRINFSEEVITLSFSDYIKYNAPLIHPIFPMKVVKESSLFYKQEFTPVEDFEFYCELFMAGLNLKVTRNAYYFYRLAPGSITARQPNNAQSKAIRYLMSQENLTPEDIIQLKRLSMKSENDFEYNTFTYYLKHKDFIHSFKCFLRHPTLMFKLFSRLPRSLRYRIKAKLLGGDIR